MSRTTPRPSRAAAGAVAGLVAALVMVACGGGDDSVAGPTTRLTLLPTTTTTLPASTTSTSTTTSSTTTTPTTTITTVTAAPTTTVAPGVGADDAILRALELGGGGIGAAAFSADPDGVVAFIGSFLGTPTEDSGWIDPFTVGSCPGTEIRTVSWGALTTTYGDVSSLLEGQRHFFAYAYEADVAADVVPAGLRTASGITIGSRLVDLLAAYPNVILNPPDEFTPPNFVVDDNLRGSLDGLADDSIVVGIFGGQGCGE